LGSSTRTTAVTRTADQLIDAADLRASISEALNATPIDDEGLRRAVWTFVGTERNAGTTPGHVIIALTELMTAAQITSIAERQAATRRVILWCVEAYFGHLGGDNHGARAAVLVEEPRMESHLSSATRGLGLKQDSE
jgi:hypothetical protein